MLMKLMLAALLIGSILAGILSVTAEGWSSNKRNNSFINQIHSQIIPASL